MSEYNLNQLEVLRQCFDYPNACEFLSVVNPTCSCQKLELLFNAFKNGIDISDLVNCNVSFDCLMLLCDCKSKGIDIRGLGNEFINSDLLRQIIQIKKKHLDVDMSFIVDLSFKECRDLVYDYGLFGTKEFNIYREKALMNKRMINEELKYVLMQKNK